MMRQEKIRHSPYLRRKYMEIGFKEIIGPGSPRLEPEESMEKTIRQIKRIFIAIVGFTVLLIGIAMIVLPGPAILVIPLGLAILATEFIWARKLLKRVKNTLKKKREKDHGLEAQ